MDFRPLAQALPGYPWLPKKMVSESSRISKAVAVVESMRKTAAEQFAKIDALWLRDNGTDRSLYRPCRIIHFVHQGLC